MGKNSGNTNYTMTDVDRLLHLVEESLPLGKDEWERLAVTFNSGRARGSPERDFESLRRKFKVLYSTRKPTGMPNMPPHILKAKELKQATDEKDNVIEMDEEADSDQRYVEPDFSFEAEPDDSFFGENDGEGEHLAQNTSEPVLYEPAVTDGSVAHTSASSHTSERSEFQDLLASPLAQEGLEAFARTPRPAPLRADRPSGAAAGSSKPRKPAANTAASNTSAVEEHPVGRLSGKRADKKKKSKYQNFSNRLGGDDLADFRDTIGTKRALDEDKETLEASYAKAKRIRAARATTALKTKLTGLENAANSMGG
jgi:hypothetical protein